MPAIRNSPAYVYERPIRIVRRTLEYALAISMALLCSYWIVQARW
jgi:hypothetical protein